MTNPFFVLTGDNNEVIAVIRHHIGKQDVKELLKESIKKAAEEYFGGEVTKIVFPANYESYHKPIEIVCDLLIDDEPARFTLLITQAWEY